MTPSLSGVAANAPAQAGILTGPAIRAALTSGAIVCSPLDPEQVSQASLDVHLHRKILVHKRGHGGLQMKNRTVTLVRSPMYDGPPEEPEDVRVAPDVEAFEIAHEGHVFMPGVLYLGATIENLYAPRLAMLLSGKSSLARRGIEIHTAGFIEPGFRGQITLEITVAMPIRLYPGWPIGQVTFETLVGEVESYQNRGHYTGSLADGPVPSQSHKHRQRHEWST